ncbi:MAG TPA: glycosyltransferase family 39 protein [Candidatus Binataceae bacterium]|nr:glycosyltransferase family 39 protein [Candidatus Binataceae bacterium]
MLALAILLGGFLRLHDLGAHEIMLDEGDSWRVARLESSHVMVELEQHDQGKLPIYFLMLHGWIRLFGDGLATMRIPGALLGTVNIFLVFALMRTLLTLFAEGADPSLIETACVAAALFMATNTTMMAVDRTVRMYTFVVAMELLQTLFFVRSVKHGRTIDAGAATLFGALAIAGNYTAVMLLFSEGVWLLVVAAGRSRLPRLAQMWFWPPVLALVGSALIVAVPIFIATNRFDPRVVNAVISYAPQPVWWPIADAGFHLGNVVAVLACVSLIGIRGRFGVGIGFLSFCFFGPNLIVWTISETITPFEMFRYLLIAFVAAMCLAAIFLASTIPYAMVVAAAIALSCLFTPYRYWDLPVAWREAASAAERLNTGRGQVAVAPWFAESVVRYYYPEARRAEVVGTGGCGGAPFLILSGLQYDQRGLRAKLTACYPNILWRENYVELRGRE